MGSWSVAISEHFSDAELRCKCGCGRNEMDDGFLAMLEQLRTLSGSQPLRITSGYRCPSHNANVSKTGQTGPHTTGRAVDIALTPENSRTLIYAAFGMGFAGIGLALKGPGRFLHVDDAHTRTAPALWGY